MTLFLARGQLTPIIQTPAERLLQPQFPTPVSSSRKRKRDEEKKFLGDAFTIQSHGSSPFDAAVRITPAVLLPRNRIPFSWATSGSPTRFFSAQIPVLEIPGNVLIAKYENDRQLAVVERIKDGLFTLYRLSNHVRLKDIRKMASQVVLEPQATSMASMTYQELPTSDDTNWWSCLKFEDLALVDHPKTAVNRIIRHNRLSNILKATKVVEMPSVKPIINAPLARLLFNGPITPMIDTPSIEGPAPFAGPTPQELLSNINRQYYEALYITKTSLAYFAKSTLSRARVEFHTDNSSPKSRIDLVMHLQDMIKSIETNDKKFKLSLPQLIKDEKIENVDVFGDNEVEFARRWVESINGEDLPIRSAEQIAQRAKQKLSELRTRETELQIILLLEILSIRRKLPKDKLDQLDAAVKQKNKKGKKSKGKTPKHSILLDLLVDRLCIWQSIGAEIESGNLGEHVDEDKSDHDHLRHFSVEIVMTFYGPRLPEECASIKRKCAGKTAVSRQVVKKHVDTNKQTDKDKPKAGQPTLSRSQSVQKPVTLPRSNTAPALLGNSYFEEREIEELNGDTQDVHSKVDQSESQDVAKKSLRGGITQSKAFDKRIVEVNRATKGASQKDVERKAKIDEQLKNAIKNISKPQRITAIEEATCKNTIAMKAGAKKTRKPTVDPSTSVEVAATPAKNRKRYYSRKQLQQTTDEDDSLNNSPIPASNKKRDRGVEIFDEGMATPTKIPRLERHKSALLPTEHHSSSIRPNLVFPSSPSVVPDSRAHRSKSDTITVLSKAKENMIENTPTKYRKAPERDDFWSNAGFVGDTPTKSVKGKDALNNGVDKGYGGSLENERSLSKLSSARKLTKARVEGEKAERREEGVNEHEDVGDVSIYESLGWD